MSRFCIAMECALVRVVSHKVLEPLWPDRFDGTMISIAGEVERDLFARCFALGVLNERA